MVYGCKYTHLPALLQHILHTRLQILMKYNIIYIYLLFIYYECAAFSISLNSLINDLPTAYAKLTGTALPICLYFELNRPANSQSSGNVCMRAYSLTVSGRVSIGWQRSVCFCAGAHVNVRLGSSSDKRRAIPVFPPASP